MFPNGREIRVSPDVEEGGVLDVATLLSVLVVSEWQRMFSRILGAFLHRVWCRTFKTYAAHKYTSKHRGPIWHEVWETFSGHWTKKSMCTFHIKKKADPSLCYYSPPTRHAGCHALQEFASKGIQVLQSVFAVGLVCCKRCMSITVRTMIAMIWSFGASLLAAMHWQ